MHGSNSTLWEQTLCELYLIKASLFVMSCCFKVRLDAYTIQYTLQMFAGNCRDFAGKSECRDFKFRGIACIPAIPVFLKSSQSDFHCNICREFDIAEILWGFPTLDVGKPCNDFNFWRYTCKICRDSL